MKYYMIILIYFFFVIPVPLHCLTFCVRLYFPITDVIVIHHYILFLRSRKINTKCYNKKRKETAARNIIGSKKILFSDFCWTRFSRSGKNCTRM